MGQERRILQNPQPRKPYSIFFELREVGKTKCIRRQIKDDFRQARTEEDEHKGEGSKMGGWRTWNACRLENLNSTLSPDLSDLCLFNLNISSPLAPPLLQLSWFPPPTPRSNQGRREGNLGSCLPHSLSSLVGVRSAVREKEINYFSFFFFFYFPSDVSDIYRQVKLSTSITVFLIVASQLKWVMNITLIKALNTN